VGYSTIPEALLAAGKAADLAVEDLRTADCGAPVNQVAADLPGSTAGGAATSFAHSWSEAFSAWCRDAGEHADALSDAASSYQATEQRNEHNLTARDPH
jgi:hypothetical protein